MVYEAVYHAASKASKRPRTSDQKLDRRAETITILSAAAIGERDEREAAYAREHVGRRIIDAPDGRRCTTKAEAVAQRLAGESRSSRI